jgi:hypothetical protein
MRMVGEPWVVPSARDDSTRALGISSAARHT